MNMIPSRPNPTWTKLQLRRHLGMIPAERILLDPLPGTATEEDVLFMDDHHNRLCELVDGVLVAKPMGSWESLLAADMLVELKIYLRRHNLGEALGEAGFLELMPGMVRAPDVSFISWERMPGRESPQVSIAALQPDLAVEVISKGNTKKEMDRKLGEYFANGTRLAWLVYPKKRIVDVYTSPTQKRRLTSRQTLDGGEVLPGFRCSLTMLFGPRRGPSPC
jgi:Uma2 family endonuclease